MTLYCCTHISLFTKYLKHIIIAANDRVDKGTVTYKQAHADGGPWGGVQAPGRRSWTVISLNSSVSILRGSRSRQFFLNRLEMIL